MQTCQNCVHTQVSTMSKHYTFLMQTCQNCVHTQVSTISKHYTLLCKHVKIASTHKVSTISKHYTFPMQTCQNCVHTQSVHCIKTLHFAMQTCQNCVHTQSVHYIKTLHFSYANMSKLRPYTKCPLYQNTTLLLHKHVKIASSYICPQCQSTHISCANLFKICLYQTLHFAMQTHQNCVLIHVSTTSNTTLSLCKITKIASLYKMSTMSIHYTLQHQGVKIASISTCPPYQKHYTFPIQTRQNCVLMQMSTISNDYTSFQDHMPVSTISKHYTLLHKHVKIASISKCPLYQSLHIFQNHMPVSTI